MCQKIEEKYLDFSPELVVEILSPSTAVKDRNIKKEIYLSEEVKYFLILDPQMKKIEIYEAINNAYSPVSISPNNFVFTFKDGCTATLILKIFGIKIISQYLYKYFLSHLTHKYHLKI